MLGGSGLQWMLAVITVALLMTCSTSDEKAPVKRIYDQQFPPGSEHLPMPTVAFFSVFMGEWKYTHTELLFESMKWNPMVMYNIIYIVSDPEKNSTAFLRDMAQAMEVPNVRVVPLSLEELREKVKEKLQIDVPFTAEWFYKLCDYKPTLAYMFPELVQESEYKFWGYGDNDVIWGNFSRYSYWFQGHYKFIISGWFGTTGAAAFYPNEEMTRNLFLDDKKYVPLLQNISYHNLDEGGTQTKKEWVIDRGQHSISEIQKRRLNKMGPQVMNRSGDWKDHCFLDAGDAGSWAGPIRWWRGSLQVIHGSPEFPPGRELLFFHRPHKFSLPPHLRGEMIQDMTTYGYLLPSWVPILTRHKCRQAGAQGIWDTKKAMHNYHPYQSGCYPRMPGTKDPKEDEVIEEEKKG